MPDAGSVYTAMADAVADDGVYGNGSVAVKGRLYPRSGGSRV